MESHEDKGGSERPLVSVVDYDESVRESLPDLLMEFGFSARTFSSAQEFLSSDYVQRTRCLILDIVMPGMTGPELQRELKLRQQRIPIVFMTAKKTGTVREQVLEQGAVECLFKHSATPLCSKQSTRHFGRNDDRPWRFLGVQCFPTRWVMTGVINNG